jgi:hypothetical protein
MNFFFGKIQAGVFRNFKQFFYQSLFSSFFNGKHSGLRRGEEVSSLMMKSNAQGFFC